MFGINVGGGSAFKLTKARLDSLKLRSGPTKQAEECQKSGWSAYNLRTRMISISVLAFTNAPLARSCGQPQGIKCRSLKRTFFP